MRDILCRVKEGRNVLHTKKGTEANWIGHIWLRNCLLQNIIIIIIIIIIIKLHGLSPRANYTDRAAAAGR